MSNDVNFLFATFSAKASTEAVEFPKYTGVAPVKILAVNPNKAWLEENMKMKLEEEPVYVYEKDGKKSAKISFYVKTDEKSVGVETTLVMSFWVADSPFVNRENTKVQVINAYGESAWITNEDFEAGVLPSTTSMSPNGVRQAFRGEVSLVEFLRAYLNVPSRTFKNRTTGEWEQIPNPDEALGGLDSIPSYFDGNFSELEELIQVMPENKVKVWFGVRTTEDNKNYQDFFKDRFAKNNVSNYDYIKTSIQNAKSSGMYADTDFGKDKFMKWEEGGATSFAAPDKAPVTVETAKKMFFNKK